MIPGKFFWEFMNQWDPQPRISSNVTYSLDPLTCKVYFSIERCELVIQIQCKMMELRTLHGTCKTKLICQMYFPLIGDCFSMFFAIGVAQIESTLESQLQRLYFPVSEVGHICE